MTAREEGFVKGKAPELEQDALVKSNMGMQAKMTPKPEDDGDVSSEQVESSVKAIRDAINNKDAAKTNELLAAGNKAIWDEIGQDSALIQKLQKFPEKERNTAYDILHFSITDADLLVDIIYQRFGVMLVGKNQHKKEAENHLKAKQKKNPYAEANNYNKVDFSAVHAQQIYSAYMCMPQAALDKITFVASQSNHADDEERASGFAGTPTNNIVLNSQVGKELARNGVAFGDHIDGTTTKDADAARNTVFLQWAAIHELGHVIDTGSKFSQDPDFRKCSGWEEYSERKTVIEKDFLKNNVKDPYLSNFSKGEQELTKEIAEQIVTTGSEEKPKALIKENKKKLSNYSVEQFEELYDKSFGNRKDGGINLLKAASLGLYDSVYYDNYGYEWMRDHMERPGHLYKSTWWTYDKATREAGKISAYQYAFPREDFAEAYACYYYTEILDDKEKAGGKMPEKLKAWFDAHKKQLET